MPMYYYQAKRQNGSELLGSLDAASPKAAMQDLRAQQLLVLQISDQDPSLLEKGRQLTLKEKVIDNLPVVKKDRIFLYRQLAMMLRSGLTLTRALSLLASESSKKSLRNTLNAIVEDVQAGMSFSESIKKYPRIFETLDVNMIASSEMSGEMHQSLEKIADHHIFWGDVKAKVIQALVYPCIVFAFIIVVGLMIVFKIIPTFEKYILKKGVEIPRLTQFILDVSNFIRFNIVWIILAAICSIIAVIICTKNTKTRPLLERLMLNIPLLGTVFQYSALTQFSTTMSALLKSGLDLVNSLKVISRLMRLKVYKNIFDESVERIIAGYTLKESLSSKYIPVTMINVVSVGEETGELGSVLKEVGDFYSMRLERVVMLLASLVEPALILFIGAMVSIVYLGLFQTILTLTTGR